VTILADAPRVALGDLLGTHDVVGVGEEEGREYILVTPRVAASDPVDLREIGTAIPSPFTAWARQEYNQELLGLNGLRMYDKMRRNDGTVRGTLRLVKTPVLAANWFVEPASDKPLDKKKAEFVWKNLTEWMCIDWSQFLTESLLMLDFGFYMFEKVFAHGEDVTGSPEARGKIVWHKFAPRHPMDIKEIYFENNGEPDRFCFYSQALLNPSMYGGVWTAGVATPMDTELSYRKMLVFSFDKEGGNVEGISVLRSAYKHWYYKDNLYKIDAIQKERHGIGVPIIKLPQGFNNDDKNLANELGRNLRTNERAHVVLPPMWDLVFAKLEGQPVDALASAKHHDDQIRANVLAPFLDSASTTKEEDQAMFLKATRFIADIVIGEINKRAIPELIDMNWTKSPNGYPKLRARRIGEQADWRTESFALRNYVGAGIVRPDDNLEAHIRDEMGLPPADKETTREVATPQNGNKVDKKDEGGKSSPDSSDPSGSGDAGKPAKAPGKPSLPRVGPPRQGPPSSKPPGASPGIDKSGGK
jgi:hypothetical protein